MFFIEDPKSKFVSVIKLISSFVAIKVRQNNKINRQTLL